MNSIERRAISDYKKKDLKLGIVKTISDVLIPDFNIGDINTSLSRLQLYLDKALFRKKLITLAAHARQYHFLMFLCDKSEETHHRHWRLGMLYAVKDAKEKLKYWTKKRDQWLSHAIIKYERRQIKQNIVVITTIKKEPVHIRKPNQKKKKRRRKRKLYDSAAIDQALLIESSNVDNEKKKVLIQLKDKNCNTIKDMEISSKELISKIKRSITTNDEITFLFKVSVVFTDKNVNNALKNVTKELIRPYFFKEQINEKAIKCRLFILIWFISNIKRSYTGVNVCIVHALHEMIKESKYLEYEQIPIKALVGTIDTYQEVHTIAKKISRDDVDDMFLRKCVAIWLNGRYTYYTLKMITFEKILSLTSDVKTRKIFYNQTPGLREAMHGPIRVPYAYKNIKIARVKSTDAYIAYATLKERIIKLLPFLF